MSIWDTIAVLTEQKNNIKIYGQITKLVHVQWEILHLIMMEV
jgi:hypothetical protein